MPVKKSWATYRFGDLCQITRGASPRPINDWIGPIGIPWVKISDATKSNSRYIEITSDHIRHGGQKYSVEVFPGDLIVSNSATPGIPKIMGINACIHDGWLLLRNFRGLDKMFALYLLQTKRGYLISQGNGSVFTNLKTEILKNLQVELPDVDEQRRIAHILSTLDDKIENNRKTAKTLEAMSQAIFKSWFVDFDPVRAKASGESTESICKRLKMTPEVLALFPDGFEDSELGKIPRGWKVGTIYDYYDVIMGQSPPGETYNENGYGLPFYQGSSDFEFRYPRLRVFCTSPTRFANKGDTLFSVRAPVGETNMALAKCAIGRGVAAIRHKSLSIPFTYFSINALSDTFGIFNSEGTVFGAIGKSDFRKVNSIEPVPEIIKAFDGITSQNEHLLLSLHLSFRALSKIRDTLLPKLMSGEIRVPEAEHVLHENLVAE